MAVPEGPTDKRYIGNGVTKTFTIPFLLLAATDLDVFIDGIEVISGFTVTSVGYPTSTLTFAVAPADQADIYLQLDVPFERLNDYQENGDFLSSTVNRDFDRIWQALKQLLRWAGRSLRLGYFDVDGRGWYRAKGNGIRDLHDPVNPQDAVTKKYADELTLDTTQYTDTQMLRTVRTANGETLSQLPSASSRANKVMGFDAAGQPIGLLPASGSGTELAIDLANSIDPNKGSAMLGRGVVAIATIADLLTATHKSDVIYRVESYHKWSLTTAYLGPLGGGDFKFLEGSTIPAEGGAIFEVPGGRLLRIADITSVNVEWYGAVGDGVADDTAELRLAFRSEVPYDNDYGYTFLKPGGRKIILRPGGNYRITAPIYQRKGDWLEGGGYTATRIFSNQVGIGQLIYVGWALVDGILTKDPGGLIPKITGICLAETVGGVNAIFLDGISGWDVRDCWFFADCGVRTVGITNDGFMLNCVADNGSGHLAIFEGTGDGYHTGQSTVVQNCGAFKTRYGGIKVDGVSDVLIIGGFLNFVPFYGLYTGTVKKNSRIKAIGVNFKGDIAGAGMDPTQQHVRVTAPTDGFALVDCGFAYSLNADIQANYPVQVSGGYSTKAAIDSIVCLGGRSSIKGMRFADTGRHPVRSTVRIDVEGLEMENPLSIGVPADIFARGAIYLSGSGSKSTAFNCHRHDDKGPAVSTNGLNGIRSSGNTSEGDVDVLHYTGNGVNYSVNERAENPVGLWRNVELLRGGYTRWIESSGRSRIKNGDPTSETDGTVVGAQA
ncbi:hypothetical protein [Pseudomonas sp. CCI3.1]|uniref:hypothetical protein n=1 Tax=Pseudomonas sp. CCI3.1 TaxID=3048618 RepID=UPI002AB4B13F|nr:MULTISPECIES: hypothetical protein [unclassified Pseudomonas]MDY7581181.1 hypothetical protein [Pseudomonas sp. CCI3.1]MEB0067060.1 hypothetical protein [Pseudomonas sp. CCI3.1]MEB0073002.1 hypothetical protein [Pseudomonas sp. CCI1.4]